MVIQCWDNSTPRQLLPAVAATVDSDDYDVVITFSVAQTGRCVLVLGAINGGPIRNDGRGQLRDL